MKQICDGYNPKVLMGNWYEESFSVPQPVRDNPCKVARTKEVDIGFIDHHGKLRALNTVSRLQPWNTNNLVTSSQCTDSKQQISTVNKQNFDLPTIKNFHSTFKAQPFSKTNAINHNNETYVQIDKFNRHHRLFNEQNINELLVERQSEQQSFKSSLKPNKNLEPKQFLQSIYQMEISKPSEVFNTQNKFGVNTRQTVGDKENSTKNFRRMRSEITLKTTTNFPFTCK